MTGVVLDLFAGPGGWDEGVRTLGLAPVGIEWDDAACRTAMAAGHTRVRADVAQLPTEPMVGKVVGLIASPPCQTFSMAGKGKGRDALPELQEAVEKVWRGATPQSVCPVDLDTKSVLVLEPVRYARDLQPEWIALEQVPAVLPIWQAFAVILRHAGYSAWCGVLNSANYGVPQTRERAILIASRVRRVQPPEPTHAKGGGDVDMFGGGALPWVSMAEALGWAGAYRRTRGEGMVERHGTRDDAESTGPAPTITSKARTDTWALRNGTQKNACVRDVREPAGTIFFGHQANDVSWVLRGQSEPAPTIVTTRRSSEGLIVGRQLPEGEESRAVGGWDWTQDRPATTVQGDPRIWPPSELPNGAGAGSVRVTVEEAAVLQSFRPDYPWQGSRTKQFEQVGNAVPPRLALHVVAAVLGLGEQVAA